MVDSSAVTARTAADLDAITGPPPSRWRRTRTGDLGGARRQGIGHLVQAYWLVAFASWY
jgi:hypothetical protein